MTTATIASQPQSAAVPTPPCVPVRLAALDAFRGWTMFWIVGGGSLMVGLRALGHNQIMDCVVTQLAHTPWQGLRYLDLIWPSFMLMTGMSLPFSYAKQSLTKTHAQITLKVLRRVVVLILLGSLRQSLHYDRFYLVELSSALQPIAIAYLVAFLIVRRSWRFQALVGAAILLGYALLLAFVPAAGVPTGSYRMGTNLVTAVDIAVLGRAAPDGWGTVLSTIPTIATTILGLLLGRLLLSNRPPWGKALIIVLVGVSCLALGLALDPVVPIIMKIWTTSYGLVSAGWACLMFLPFYLLCDVWGYRKWAFPLVVIGMNALAIYMAQSLVPIHKIVYLYTTAAATAAGAYGPLLQAVAVLAVEWLILYWMYNRKIFLTA